MSLSEWSAGVDYVRLTHTGKALAPWSYEVYRQAVQDLAVFYTGEAPLSGWRFQGYEGEISGKASSGIREDGAILQVTGSWSDSEDLLALPRTGVPRLDIQVTVWGLPSPHAVPRTIADRSHAAASKCGRKPWDVACYDKYGKGDTAYLGSRQSETFVRVYDKGLQSGEAFYGGAVRYEVELKGRVAAETYAALGTGGQRPEGIAARVQGFLAARGVSLPDRLQVGEIKREQPKKEQSTTDQSLRWLAEQVRPTVVKLLRRGVPYEQLHEVLFGLGPDGWLDADERVPYTAGEPRSNTKLRP